MPRINDDDTDTQLVDDVNQQQVDDSNDQVGHSDENANDDQGAKKSYFLDVDERHRYETVDDAKKAISESGRRISELAAWEKDLEEYGVSSPKEVRQYLDELITLRQQHDDAQRQLKEHREQSTRRTDADDTQRRQPQVKDDEDSTKEEREVRKWLVKQGYVTKEEADGMTKGAVKALEAKISEIDNRFAAQDEQRFQSNVRSGQSQLRDYMTEQKVGLRDDGSISRKTQMEIEDEVRIWVNGSQERVDTFRAGGRAAERMLEEGFKRAAKILDLTPAAAANGNADKGNKPKLGAPGSAQNKAAALKRNRTQLPQQGLPGSQPGNDKKKSRFTMPNGDTDYIGQAHEKAREVFRSHTGSGE